MAEPTRLQTTRPSSWVLLIPQLLSNCLVTQLCPTLCNPLNCSLPVSFVHGNFLGKNTGVGCHFLLQGVFPTQRSNPHFLCLLHCRQILYLLMKRFSSDARTAESSFHLIEVFLTECYRHVLSNTAAIATCDYLKSSQSALRYALKYTLDFKDLV